MTQVPTHSLRPFQYIGGAFVMGVVMFCTIALVVDPTSTPGAEIDGTSAARTLVAMACGESIAFFAPIIYLISGSPLAAAPLVVGLGLLLVQFPSRERLRSAVESAGRPSY